MRNMLALIGLVVVLFVGLGWFYGWYTFNVQPGTDGKQHIQVELDSKKLTSDVKRFGNTVENAIQNSQPANATTPTTPTTADSGRPQPLAPVVAPKPQTPAPNTIHVPIEITIPGSGDRNR